MLKKFISVLLITALIIIALPYNTCYADTVYGPIIDLKTYKIEGHPEGVTLVLDFIENPGIGAMAFTVKYDNSVFETKGIRKSKFYTCKLRGYLFVDHPESGYVSIVWAESNGKNITQTGNLIELDFSIKNRTVGEYTFSASNSNPSAMGTALTGAFADFDKNTLIPTINPAKIYVGKNGYCSSYSEHSFTDWETTNPSCETEGIKQRYCKNCDYIENKTIPATGHDYQSEWTVDKEASDGILGIKSRHCKNCSSTTDKKYYSIENGKEVDDEKIVDDNVDNKTDGGSKENTDNPTAIKDIISVETNEEDIDFEEIPDAEKIIEKVNKAKNNKTIGDVFTKVHKYLFGDESKNGLFDIILDWIKQIL